MNLVIVWVNKDGVKEVMTCPNNGLVLPGITKDTILHILKNQSEYKVNIKEYTIQTLLEGIKEKRVLEMFGIGTAVAICPVKGI